MGNSHQKTTVLNLSDIPGFTAPAVPGHTSKLQSFEVETGKPVIVFGSRTHLYEGRGAEAVAHQVRTAKLCGAEIIILTNGAGGISPDLKTGEAVLISDHINMTGSTPLSGPSFVDLTDLYSQRLRELAKSVDSGLREGVYIQFRGPQYETPAEIRMAQRLGADMVGMSTALEAIAAREAGVEVLGLSLITNIAAGLSPKALNHDEVIETGRRENQKLSTLLMRIIAEI